MHKVTVLMNLLNFFHNRTDRPDRDGQAHHRRVRLAEGPQAGRVAALQRPHLAPARGATAHGVGGVAQQLVASEHPSGLFRLPRAQADPHGGSLHRAGASQLLVDVLLPPRGSTGQARPQQDDVLPRCVRGHHAPDGILCGARQSARRADADQEQPTPPRSWGQLSTAVKRNGNITNPMMFVSFFVKLSSCFSCSSVVGIAQLFFAHFILACHTVVLLLSYVVGISMRMYFWMIKPLVWFVVCIWGKQITQLCFTLNFRFDKTNSCAKSFWWCFITVKTPSLLKDKYSQDEDWIVLQF